MSRVYSVNIDVDFEDLETDDLIEEIKARGYSVVPSRASAITRDECVPIAQLAYEAFCVGDKAQYEALSKQLVMDATGRIM